jgi:hypothetical protein
MALRASGRGIRAKVVEDPEFKLDNEAELLRQSALYFKLANINVMLRKRYQGQVLDVHYSEFMANPSVQLQRVCKFLNITCDEDFLEACMRIIFKSETKTRDNIQWSPEILENVTHNISNIDFLRGRYFFR